MGHLVVAAVHGSANDQREWYCWVVLQPCLFSNPPTLPLGGQTEAWQHFHVGVSRYTFCVCQSIPFSSLPFRSEGGAADGGPGGAVEDVDVGRYGSPFFSFTGSCLSFEQRFRCKYILLCGDH